MGTLLPLRGAGAAVNLALSKTKGAASSTPDPNVWVGAPPPPTRLITGAEAAAAHSLDESSEPAITTQSFTTGPAGGVNGSFGTPATAGAPYPSTVNGLTVSASSEALVLGIIGIKVGALAAAAYFFAKGERRKALIAGGAAAAAILLL
jgi:hypothetical protein